MNDLNFRSDSETIENVFENQQNIVPDGDGILNEVSIIWQSANVPRQNLNVVGEDFLQTEIAVMKCDKRKTINSDSISMTNELSYSLQLKPRCAHFSRQMSACCVR